MNSSLRLDLPLSWVRSKVEFPVLEKLQFYTSRQKWFSLANIPEGESFDGVLASIHKNARHGLLMRGCNDNIANMLHQKGYETMFIGQEAVLDLQKRISQKASIAKLIKRGQKHGICEKLATNKQNALKLERFKKQCTHGDKPQLQHLFVDSMHPATECFTFKNASGNLLAVISISKVNERKVHTELLLRAKSAPIGVMEALMAFVESNLIARGFSFWSLGEVPFINKENRVSSIKSRIPLICGRWLKFAYNSQTLYNFKDKFNPHWQPLYLCGYPRISYLALAELSVRSNYLRLVVSQLRKKIWTKLFSIKS